MKKIKDIMEESALIASFIYDWITDYIPKKRGNSQHTKRAYTNALKLFVEFLEAEKGVKHTELSSKNFSASTIQEWLFWLKEQRGCSNNTCNHRLACIRSFISYLGHCDLRFVELENEIVEVKRMKAPKKGITEISKNAMKALFASIPQTTRTGKRDLALFTLMYNTATRINEILSLHIDDVKILDKDTHSYIQVLGKGAKRRVIPIVKENVNIIKAYIRQFHGALPKGEDLLFYSIHNGKKDKLTQEAVGKRLKIYAKKANTLCVEMPENIHCHNLRSARATHWLEDGLNIVMIQKLLGHENITTTMDYVAVSYAQKSNALASLEDDVSKSAAKLWKKMNTRSSLAELLGLKTDK